MAKRNYYERFCFLVLKNTLELPSAVEDLGKNKDLLKLYLEAPASSKYHCSFEGGLAMHTYSTMDIAFRMFHSFVEEVKLNMNDVITAILWHDMGKIGLVDKNSKLIEPYYTNLGDGYTRNGKLNIPHQELSSSMYNTFVNEISLDVYKAIRYHNMLYTDSFRSIGKESPLMLLVHWADMFSCRFSLLEGEV